MNPASMNGMYPIYLDRGKPGSLPFRGMACRRCRIIQLFTTLEDEISPFLIDRSGTF
jgi:hypothetical protein